MKKNFGIREETTMGSPTIHNESIDFILPPQQNEQMQGSVSIAEWTDEKHSMYLNSMEASFVDQLSDLKETLGCFSQFKTSRDTAAACSQFKVLRGGSWQKTSFVRENPQSSRLNECHDLKANPWIQRYRSSCNQRSLEVPVIDIEMSDQNFADEEVESEKENNRRDVKRLKS